MRGEYLPLLSGLLLGDGIIAKPLQAVIRKGKSHYVCEERLERRLGQLDLQKKNWKAGTALLTLRGQLDMSEAAHLSHYDRERICIPRICDCQRETCRYRAFLENCDSGQYLFQICNHNLLLADAIRRGSGRRPILPDACALIVDEAHKLPESARQMFGVTLTAEDIRTLTHSLRGERFLLAAEILSDSAAPLLRKLNRPLEKRPFAYYARSLVTPEQSLTVIDRQLHGLLTPATRRRLKNVSSTVSMFHQPIPAIQLIHVRISQVQPATALLNRGSSARYPLRRLKQPDNPAVARRHFLWRRFLASHRHSFAFFHWQYSQIVGAMFCTDIQIERCRKNTPAAKPSAAHTMLDNIFYSPPSLRAVPICWRTSVTADLLRHCKHALHIAQNELPLFVRESRYRFRNTLGDFLFLFAQGTTSFWLPVAINIYCIWRFFIDSDVFL